jgi:uncharacterized protein YqfA (UPF0365 family)
MRLRLLLLSPLLLLLVLFALSNTVIVPIGLWPTGIALQAPVSVAILIGMVWRDAGLAGQSFPSTAGAAGGGAGGSP